VPTAPSNTGTDPTAVNERPSTVNEVAGSVAKVPPKPVTVNGNTFTYTFPAYSSVAIVLHGS
jgi:hypothetical protein